MTRRNLAVIPGKQHISVIILQIGICDKRSVKCGIEQDQKDVVREGDDQGKLQPLLLEPIAQYEHHIAYRPS